MDYGWKEARPQTLTGILEQRTLAHPDRIALTMQGQNISYADLVARANALGSRTGRRNRLEREEVQEHCACRCTRARGFGARYLDGRVISGASCIRGTAFLPLRAARLHIKP